MNHINGSAADRECAPGELMRLVAGGLAARGFEIRSSGHEADRRLMITGLKDANGWVLVEDCGEIECEYVPQSGRTADPAVLTSLAKSLLGSDSEERHPAARKPHMQDLTLKGIVGRELKAAGFDVDLDVCEDLDAYEVRAEIVVMNPGKPERGEIRISDDGEVTWRRDRPGGYGADAAEITGKAADFFAYAVAGSSDATRAPSPDTGDRD
jgi:hypothetical protein